MTQEYYDPKRASDPHALPDIEIWREHKTEISCKRGCGLFDVPTEYVDDMEYCPSCEHAGIDILLTDKRSYWWYWYCFPGRLPDSSVYGPFDSYDEALSEARDE